MDDKDVIRDVDQADDKTGDAETGAKLGGVGGAVTGAIAGSAAGPAGTIIGAVVGGVAGAVGSGLAVGAVDKIDDDSTVTGIGPNMGNDASDAGDPRVNQSVGHRTGENYAYAGGTETGGIDTTRGNMGTTSGVDPNVVGTGPMSQNPRVEPGYGGYGTNADRDDLIPGNDVPGVQTGGRNADGSPDTRGVTEKASDFVTGDDTDDKTGKRTD